jgi:hypothetical protein
MKVLNNLDLNLFQLLNGVLQQLGSDVTPATANKGQIYYNSTTNLAKLSNGTTVDTITNILEGVTGVGAISVGAISSKSQAISIAAASGSVPGTMSAADFSKLAASTNLNTASAIVQRDGSGNFAAGTITAALTGTASNATQLNSQAASFYLARGNHTGTQLASTISDFDTQVNTHTINQLTAPTADFSMNTHKITGLVDPTGAQDAATKNYVDSVATGLDVKASVRAASTANIAGATYNQTGGTSGRGQFTTMPNSIDGVTLAAGNRVLVKNQTTGAQNGIYVVSTLGTGANGVWDRATDFDQDAEVTSGAFTFVEEGTTNAAVGYVLTTANPITIGGASGTSLAFAQFSGGAAYTAGNGINLTSNVFSVKVDTTTTNPNSLSVSGNGVTIATTYVGQASITTLGTVTTGVWNGTSIAVANGGTGATTAAAARTNLGAVGKFSQTLSTSSTSYVVTHNLGTVDVDIIVIEVSTGNTVLADTQATSTNTATITFGSAPSANAYRVTVIG